MASTSTPQADIDKLIEQDNEEAAAEATEAIPTPDLLPSMAEQIAQLRTELMALKAANAPAQPPAAKTYPPLPAEFSALADPKMSSQDKAKYIRAVFQDKGWEKGSWGPYGSPRQFMETYGLPVVDTPRSPK